jgi:tetratricopeptide (TPR) repeat protein
MANLGSRSALGLVALGLSLAAPHGDAAAEGAIQSDLARASADLATATGPATYTALREVWRTWDRADPTQVEETLRAFAERASTTPPMRAYAGLMLAYARRRRGDLDGSIAAVDKLGFANKWLVVGPFDNEGKGGLARTDAPELELAQARVDLGRSYEGKERQVRWRAVDGTRYGWLDFGTPFRPREKVCGYATTYVREKASKDPKRAATGKHSRPISLWIGSDGAFKVFYNGARVLSDGGYRDLDADRFATTVQLSPGANRITVKVCGDDDPPKLMLRVADDKGAPDASLELTTDPGTEIAPQAVDKTATTPDAKDKAKARGSLQGAVQAFEAEIAKAKAGAAAPNLLEAYARYLALTSGDPKPDHTARDLAARAATASPSVRRLILAGELAEDRNQTRSWVDQADAFVKSHTVDRASELEVVFAHAKLARTGPNWRDAVPIYERVLALDPDHVGAQLGLVELYVEAGLKRTALATLERAVDRQPKSVALLRVYAQELRSVGRDAEASEVEGRYAALRFDDSGFLNSAIELAIARRDTEGAVRWLERFLRSESDSAFTQGVAARVYKALGQRGRAITAYQRALTLAPEDVTTLRALSDLYGEDDKREEQLRLLRQILAVSPQAKDVREYVEHIEPPKPRLDETFAWSSEKLLALRAGGNKAYPKRTLRSLTVSTVFPNGLATRFRQIVYQPMTDEGAAGGREYHFDYQADRQTVTLRAAKVYRVDGRVDEAVESGDVAANDPSMQMYSSARVFYVRFPRLDAGDVVELRYRVEDVQPRNEIADYFGEVEYMGADEPVANSELVLITPKTRTFYVNAQSVPNLKREAREEGDVRIERFIADEVAPIAAEPAMPAYAEIVPHIHVSTFKTWDEVGAWYWGLAKDQFDVDDEVRKKVREITKGLTDDASKVRAIYKYATETRYVALEFGLEGIRPRRCAQTLARGWGDCKDKATLIVGMLREVGIKATIVLVRTNHRGGIEDSPASLAPFDHAIAYVPSMDLYLDGTAEHCGSTELPSMDRGAFALQINEGKPKLVRLPEAPPEASKTTRKIDLTLGSDGSADAKLDLTITGVTAPEWRARLLAEGTRRERAQREIGGELGVLDLAAGKAGLETNNLDDEEQAVHIKAKGKASAVGRREADGWSLPAGPTLRLVADYTSSSKRTKDVVIRALTSRDDEWTYHLPAGAKVIHAATTAKQDTPFGSFSITVEEAAGKVTVRSTLAMKKSRIAPAEYEAFRAFCEAADRAFGQRFVVTK